MVQPESKSYSTFELAGLEKGEHTIKIFSSTGDLVTEKQGIVIEENGQCSSFAFRMWKKGGLPGVICLGATLLVIIIILVYYNVVFAPREEAIRVKDEKRNKERMKRHLHKYRQARGLKTEELPNTKVIDECLANNNKKRKGKKQEVEFAQPIKEKQVEETIDIEGNDNTVKHKVVTLKRSLPVSKAARIFSDPCTIPAEVMAQVPVSKFSGVQTTDLIQFPGMTASIPNSLGYLYAGPQSTTNNEDAWRMSFIKPVPVKQGGYNMQPLVSMQPAIVPSVKPDEIHFNTAATENYTLDLGTDPSEITVEENPYATLMQLEQSENTKIIQSMNHDKVLDQQDCAYPELTNDSQTDYSKEIEESTVECSNENSDEESEEQDESKQMNSMATGSSILIEKETKAPEVQQIEAADIQCEEQIKSEDISEEQPHELQEDEPVSQNKPAANTSEAPDNESDTQSDVYSLDSEQASGSESFSNNADSEADSTATAHADAIPEAEATTHEEQQEQNIVEEAAASMEHEETVPQIEQSNDVEPPIEIEQGNDVEPPVEAEQNSDVEPPVKVNDDHEVSTEATEQTLSPQLPFDELTSQEQPLSENGSFDEE